MVLLILMSPSVKLMFGPTNPVQTFIWWQNLTLFSQFSKAIVLFTRYLKNGPFLRIVTINSIGSGYFLFIRKRYIFYCVLTGHSVYADTIAQLSVGIFRDNVLARKNLTN